MKPLAEFTTKFSRRVQIGPDTVNGHDHYVSIRISDATDPFPDPDYEFLDLTIGDARRLAVALYHAAHFAEEEMDK